MNRQNQIKLLLSVIFFGLSVLFFSLSIQKYQVSTQTRAEFDGTACNDNIDGTLNSSGSTSFIINCTGNLNRRFTYSLFYCPDQKAGASYCVSNKIDSGEGASLTSYLSKSTDKNCGCVQWDIGVFNANGEEGIAGGAMLCAQNSCEQPPTNTPAPTTPPEQPTNTPAPTTPPGEPTNTPAPTNTPVPPSNTPVPTTPPGQPTNTPAPTATNTPVPTVLPSHTPTHTPTHTPIPTATHTPVPTNTPTPTATFTPAPTFTLAPTFTPQPTYPPQATYTPQPTQVAQIQPTNPPQALVVNDQPPGITPWLLVLVPIGLIMVGLLL